MVYGHIVRRIVIDAFEQLNRGNIAGLTARLAPGAEHYFIGDHALGGRRRQLASIASMSPDRPGARSPRPTGPRRTRAPTASAPTTRAST
jgi:hypothetical protein